MTWACHIVVVPSGSLHSSFFSNLGIIGISLVPFLAMSRSDLQLGILRSFMPIYWGYAREMEMKAAWRPKPLKSSRSSAFFFFVLVLLMFFFFFSPQLA